MISISQLISKLPVACLIVPFFLSQSILNAQPPFQDINTVGAWKGTLSLGSRKLNIVFHIKNEDQQFVVSMDSPDQGAYGLKGRNLKLFKDSISFNIPQSISYKGRFVNNDSIQGNFMQNGFTIPLGLRRSLDTAGVSNAPRRPDTPKPPFEYLSKDVTYKVPSAGFDLAATITMPDSVGKFPGILLITGSGPQDRDATIFDHHPFAVLADMLTKAGYAVLRVDDRGTAKSTGSFQGATTDDFASDAEASLDYLKNIPQIDTAHLGVIGHSEGGLIAQMLASSRKDLDFIILMAAPAVKISRLMELQNDAVTKKALPEASSEELALVSLQYKKMVQALLSSEDAAVIRQNMKDRLLAMAKQLPDSLLGDKTNLEANIEKTADLYFKGFVKSPWMNHFMRMDPTIYLRNINPDTKILALNGSEDIQVIAKDNLAAIKAAFQQTGHKDFKIQLLPRLNHLFQKCQSCTVQEYGTLTETLNPALLSTIKDWLIKEVPVKARTNAKVDTK